MNDATTQHRPDVPVVPLAPNGGGADWRALLEPSGRGYCGDERNILIALRTAPELAGLIRFNEFHINVEFVRSPTWRTADAGEPWTESDDTQCSAFLQAQGLKVRGRSAVADCIAVAGRDHTFHPVRMYLTNLTWDGTSRLARWLRDYLGAAGSEAYLAPIGTKSPDFRRGQNHATRLSG